MTSSRCLASLALLSLTLSACAQPAQEQADAAKPVELPGITVDRDGGFIDVEAEVATRDAEWLELLACTRNTREYEAILAVNAQPRDIHLGLMLLGAEPGSPMRYEHREEEGGFKVFPATGPAVRVSLIWAEGDETKQAPANQWIVQQETGEVLEGDTWMFTGSRIEEHDGESVYMADVNGSVISLVHFGDDVLARQTDLTPETDNKALSTRTEVIPPRGTAVTIRLQPVVEDEQQDEAE